MNPILNKNIFLIKEQIGIFKASNNYDVYDPQNNQIILNCREINLGFFAKIFRFTDYKRRHLLISKSKHQMAKKYLV